MARKDHARGRRLSQRVWVPIDPDDVPALERMLAAADPFVTNALDTKYPYRLVDYVHHSRVSRRKLFALLDRNLTSRAARLASGVAVSPSGADSDRVAAACMAFLITGGFLIEPGISLYELARSTGGALASEELHAFRIADHVHPQAYLDIALGRARSIPMGNLREASSLVAVRGERAAPDLAAPLRMWRRHKCAMAQIALLERERISAAEKLRGFIEWSGGEGFFDGIAIAFALLYFGTERRSGMLRGVNSADSATWKSTIDNAAWDLSYVSYWIDQCKRSRSGIWMIATHDRALTRIARASVEGTPDDLFRSGRSAALASEMLRLYEEATERVRRDPMRSKILRDRYDGLEAMTDSIVKQIEQRSSKANTLDSPHGGT
jgi:hypothetical protein